MMCSIKYGYVLFWFWFAIMSGISTWFRYQHSLFLHHWYWDNLMIVQWQLSNPDGYGYIRTLLNTCSSKTQQSENCAYDNYDVRLSRCLGSEVWVSHQMINISSGWHTMKDDAMYPGNGHAMGSWSLCTRVSGHAMACSPLCTRVSGHAVACWTLSTRVSGHAVACWTLWSRASGHGHAGACWPCRSAWNGQSPTCPIRLDFGLS